MAIERVIRDINRVVEKKSGTESKESKESKENSKVRSLKEKTTETIRTMKKNNSTDNFMKFQWSWTL